MSINELQDEVIAEFSDFDDWIDRYQLLIDLGNEQEPLDEKYKTEQNLIEGCQSRVWLQADDVDGKIVFNAESDALIVKGIIALLIKVLSGHTPDEILNPCFLARIQAIILVSSLFVAATRISDPKTSGSLIVIGLAPFAGTVNTSKVFFTASKRSSSISTTTTSICSFDNNSAILYPSFPAPITTMRTLIPPVSANLLTTVIILSLQAHGYIKG